ncbi:MAG: tRNA 2-thiouridine(34) synthase MnmA [Spirochaetes bacterium GWF1_41_5]|nr:MAG: tRNA 2-thiouridine(34) synthase MnmA [Spirochaetes bacterium GWF1_41_5]
MKNKKVIVGLSGGVDSAAAACLLLKQGYSVSGAIMSTWNGMAADDSHILKSGCYGPDEKYDIASAQKIADKLGIKLAIIDLKTEYQDYVINYFKSEYQAGRTPNPCIRCNQILKFGLLIEKLRTAFDFDFFATGHYARIIFNTAGRYSLLRGIDNSKDQSYFLYRLNQKQLSQILFPLGGMLKSEVRKIAASLQLDLEHKKESQNFASLGNDSILCRVECEPGEITDINGKILGRHNGIKNYTIGQRKGIRVPSSEPLYVVKIDQKNNRIIAGNERELYNKTIFISSLVWAQTNPPEHEIGAYVQIRYRHKAQKALIKPEGGDLVKIEFSEAQKAAAPGQSAVIYSDDEVLGGGIINETGNI